MASSSLPCRGGRPPRRLGAIVLLAVLFTAGCAVPKVIYQRAEALDVSDLRARSSTSFYFRVPRSQILVTPAGGEKRIRATVIDPVPTPEWTALPFNPGFAYRVEISQDEAGTLPMAAFRGSLGRKMRMFPVPSCRTARLEIAARMGKGGEAQFSGDPLALKLEAVPTEYDYPSTDGTLSFSPLWLAKPRRGWFSATRFNVVKYPNTQLVKALGVEVEDHFAEAITVLAGMAKTATKMMGHAGIPEEPSEENFVRVFSSSLTVADNRRIALAPLPKDGTINLHPVCGADVSEQGSTTDLDFLKNAQTAMAQAKELYDLWFAGE